MHSKNVKILTQLRMGIACPHISGSVLVKWSPAVSTTLGRAASGIPNKDMAQPAHCIVKGSKKPVADAEETSVMWILLPEKSLSIRI